VVAAEHPLEAWLTGLSTRPGTPFVTSGFDVERTVVVEDAELVPQLLATNLLSRNSRLLVRLPAADPPPAAHGRFGTYAGTFADADSDLTFDSGYRLHARPYGSAEFLTYDAPKALRVTDSDDFSAYLRDADAAWSTGEFPEHVTHPNAIIAELSALGGPADHAGPAFRLFVAQDGSVSTSPTGIALGSVGDAIEDLVQRWHLLNSASGFPDAVGLARVVDDTDRVAALRERPWIGRYLTAVGAVRGIRAEHRMPSRVSGFAGRITDGLPRSKEPDVSGAPLLLQVGRSLFAYDPVTGARLSLSGVAVAIVESLLAHPDQAHAAQWCTRSLGISQDKVGAHVQDTLRLLTGAGIAARWAGDMSNDHAMRGAEVGPP